MSGGPARRPDGDQGQILASETIYALLRIGKMLRIGHTCPQFLNTIRTQLDIISDCIEAAPNVIRRLLKRRSRPLILTA